MGNGPLLIVCLGEAVVLVSDAERSVDELFAAVVLVSVVGRSADELFAAMVVLFIGAVLLSPSSPWSSSGSKYGHAAYVVCAVAVTSHPVSIVVYAVSQKVVEFIPKHDTT